MIAAHMAKDRSAVAVLFLAWARLGRLACRFEKLVAAVRAGRLPPAPELRGKAARDLEFPRLDGLPPPRLPGGFGWLIRLVPGAAVYGSQVQYLLADPEMAALLASTPQAGRILRPLCQMLAIPLGPEPGGTRWRRAASPSRSIPPASPPRVRLCFSPWGRRGWGLPARKHRVPFCAAKWGPGIGVPALARSACRSCRFWGAAACVREPARSTLLAGRIEAEGRVGTSAGPARAAAT
ncbi:MAG: hypothetical protein JOY71_27800 [Acetobacteraceae bacterium]|nr:hypothetical protein [Acetobacteraceae bacterium]